MFSFKKHSLHFEQIGEHNISFLFVLSVVEVSALESQFVVEFFRNKTNFCTPFTTRTLFMFLAVCFVSEERICAYLLRNSFLLLFYIFFSSFIDSCPFCGRSDTDDRPRVIRCIKLFHFIPLSFHFTFFKVFSSLTFLW